MALLTVNKVIKQFGGLTAVNNVDMSVDKGTDRRRHRPQRCRQDHPVQLYRRRLPAD